MYIFKRRIIEKKLIERSKNTKFNLEKAESYHIKKNDGPDINNSYYFSAHENDLSIYCRLGIRTNQLETWFVIFYKGEKYYLNKEFFYVGKSPLWVKRSLNCWVITFDGELLDDKGNSHICNFKGAFSSEDNVIDFSTGMLPHRMAVAIAQEKWNKDFFNNLESIQGQTHYEQNGLLEGKFTLDKKEVRFSIPCVRDHSFGKRDWNYMNNHLWVMAVSRKGQLNYSMVSYPSLTILEVGNYFEGKKLRLFKEANYDLNEISRGKNIEKLNFVLTLDDETKLNVEAKVINTHIFHFQQGDYKLIENIASFNINGEEYKGILEIGFNKDNKRYFNGKKPRKLKR